MEQVRYGLVGTGMMGVEHITNLAITPGAVVTAIADPVAESIGWATAALGDGGEIHDHQWMRVADVVAAHKAGDMGMMPPTYVTLCSLLRYRSTADMIAGEEQITPPAVLPLFAKEGETFLVMFKGDAGYDNGESTTPGARHRAVMQNGSWEYIYKGVSTDYPTFIPD